jgi:NDP-sugar pyrophosphorylase family protein
MLPLLDRPFLEYALDHLRRSGVPRVIVASGEPAAIEAHFGTRVGDLSIEYRTERSPLGTGGAARFATKGFREPFLVLNGDSFTDVDLADLVGFHHSRGATATLLLTSVADPIDFGLVRVDGSGRVVAFVEKPDAAGVATSVINAGVYVLEPEALHLVPFGGRASIERDVFPALSSEGRLYAVRLPGRWVDIGTRRRYLQAHIDLLHGDIRVEATARVSATATLVPPVTIAANARVCSGASVGPDVYVGERADVGADATLSTAVVLAGAQVAAGARLVDAIVAPGIGAVPV